MRSLFTKTGGAIGEMGCVAWNFDRKGVIEVTGEGIDEDALMMAAIDAGADDLEAEDGGFEITSRLRTADLKSPATPPCFRRSAKR